MGTASPGQGLAASASHFGASGRSGISELSDGDFPLPPTPAEAVAVRRGGLDIDDGTAKLATVEGGGKYAQASIDDSLRHSSRSYGEEHLRWKLETERRDTRRRLDAMKGEVERVVGQFRERAERAEAAAVSAETRATIKALRYLRSKPQLA